MDKLAVLLVDPILIVHILTQGYDVHLQVVENGLPEDAELVGLMDVRGNKNLIGLILRSEQFESVPLNQELPYLPKVVMQRVYGGKNRHE